MTMLLYLLAGHALADYPLQGDFLARGKNRFAPIPGVPWYQCMMAHCLIHAGAVLLITHMPVLAVLELVIHFGTDYAKCAGWLASRRNALGVDPRAFDIDQAIHCGCKVLWWVIAAQVAVHG